MSFRKAALGVLFCFGIASALSPVTHSQSRNRVNKMVELLAQGKTVLGSFASNRSPEGAVEIANARNLDFVFYDMEHSPFDVTQMRVFMQFLLDRGAIARSGSAAVESPLLVRIPANGREMNQWMIKQVLDQGAYGIIVPHVETAEQAMNIVKAMRYPQTPGAPDFEPEGQRGSGPGNAVRYWGVSGAEYMSRADLWPLDPNGELANILLIENQLGVKNVREIARQKGVSIIAAAPGDLGVSYAGDRTRIEAAIQTILAAAKEFNVPCAITAGPQDVEKRIKEGFRVLIVGLDAIEIGRKAAGR